MKRNLIYHVQKTVLTEDHNNITWANFMITSTKLYVSVITLSINDNIKSLGKIKQGFKRTIFSDKHRSEITAPTKNNNLDYLIYLAFGNINILFALSFKNSNNDPTRNYWDKYYMPLVKCLMH